MKRPFRKPLVLMTPKSLLRLEAATSSLEEFTQGRFHEVLTGPVLGKSEQVKRIVLCSGKVYYDLLKFREENQILNTALIRVEQLYPLNDGALKQAIAQYPNAQKMIWCQEESQNMGAWSFIAPLLRQISEKLPLRYAGRGASASPAVGSLGKHKLEQKCVIEEAFSL
jgi:2-oxoglutarate dehydrogenase E1 component